MTLNNQGNVKIIKGLNDQKKFVAVDSRSIPVVNGNKVLQSDCYSSLYRHLTQTLNMEVVV